MSREAWGDPSDPEPQCCPCCGAITHTEGCEVCELDKQRISAEAEASALRAKLRARDAEWQQRLAAAVEAERQKWQKDADRIEIDGHSLVPSAVLRRFIRGLKPKRGQPMWSAVSEVTAHGSTVSYGLCRWAGVDPDTGAAMKGASDE